MKNAKNDKEKAKVIDQVESNPRTDSPIYCYVERLAMGLGSFISYMGGT